MEKKTIIWHAPSLCIQPPKITEIRIQIGDEWATFKDCESLQEFLDKVQQYAMLRKALDVAIDVLGYFCDHYVAENGLKKISEIMKGGK